MIKSEHCLKACTCLYIFYQFIINSFFTQNKVKEVTCIKTNQINNYHRRKDRFEIKWDFLLCLNILNKTELAIYKLNNRLINQERKR